MIKNKRLENQVMSAKVRGKHSIDLSIGEANQILTEFNRASEECTALQQQVEQLKQELSDAQSQVSAQPAPVESDKKETTSNTEQFTGILDGGRW